MRVLAPTPVRTSLIDEENDSTPIVTDEWLAQTVNYEPWTDPVHQVRPETPSLFGTLIYQLRSERSISIELLAQSSTMTQAYLLAMEEGDVIPTKPILERLQKGFDQACGTRVVTTNWYKVLNDWPCGPDAVFLKTVRNPSSSGPEHKTQPVHHRKGASLSRDLSLGERVRPIWLTGFFLASVGAATLWLSFVFGDTFGHDLDVSSVSHVQAILGMSMIVAVLAQPIVEPNLESMVRKREAINDTYSGFGFLKDLLGIPVRGLSDLDDVLPHTIKSTRESLASVMLENDLLERLVLVMNLVFGILAIETLMVLVTSTTKWTYAQGAAVLALWGVAALVSAWLRQRRKLVFARSKETLYHAVGITSIDEPA